MTGRSSNIVPPRPSLDEMVRAHLAAMRGTSVRVGARAMTVFPWSEVAIAPWLGLISRRARERPPAPRPRTAQRGAQP